MPQLSETLNPRRRTRIIIDPRLPVHLTYTRNYKSFLMSFSLSFHSFSCIIHYSVSRNKLETSLAAFYAPAMKDFFLAAFCPTTTSTPPPTYVANEYSDCLSSGSLSIGLSKLIRLPDSPIKSVESNEKS